METERKTVLIVEDEDLIRAFISLTLIEEGYSVLEAGSGEEADYIWQREQGRVDLLLIDNVLPSENGVSIAHRLLAQKPDLKVAMMSGFDEDSIENAPRDVLFMRKPFSLDTLKNIVQRAVGKGVQTELMAELA